MSRIQEITVQLKVIPKTVETDVQGELLASRVERRDDQRQTSGIVEDDVDLVALLQAAPYEGKRQIQHFCDAPPSEALGAHHVVDMPHGQH